MLLGISAHEWGLSLLLAVIGSGREAAHSVLIVQVEDDLDRNLPFCRSACQYPAESDVVVAIERHSGTQMARHL